MTDSREDGRHFADRSINGHSDLNVNEVHKSSSKGRISRSR